VPYDVRASIAHAEMLNAAKLLDDADLAVIGHGLNCPAPGMPRADGGHRARPTKTARQRSRSG
jgi:hypothetical protein